MATKPVISVEYIGRVAIITIDNQRKLNALNQQQYYVLAQTMREVATHNEVYITLLIGEGRFFSAGADVTISRTAPPASKAATTAGAAAITPHQHWLQTFAAFNLNIAHAFYTHPKILVSALNGPAVGLSAALIAHSDFIYATPSAYILVPFSSLGLVAEGLASRALVRRLGPARSGEALLMSKRVTADELERCGFVNAVFAAEGFRLRVLEEVKERLGSHLDGESLVGIKKLVRGPDRREMDAANVREVFAGLERFMKGVPQQEFAKLASGEKRHKL